MKLRISDLCSGDYKRCVVVKCWDWNKNDSPDLIGETTITVQDLIDAKSQQSPPSLTLVKPHKKLRPSGPNRLVH